MATDGAASIRIPVTGGNLRNGHIYVRDQVWFFPKTAIRGERQDERSAAPCTLRLSGYGEVETEIDAARGMFCWRGWKKFFDQQHVREGDYIVFARLEKDVFDVSVEHVRLAGFETVSEPNGDETEENNQSRRKPARSRCNDLTGEEWLRYSISIWSDIRKTSEEVALNHPAMFPTMLCERLMMMFLRRRGKHRILDPFMGSGSTLLAAKNLGKIGVGIEISPEYVTYAKRRLDVPDLFSQRSPSHQIHQADARSLLEHVSAESIDFCITSPPYWDILNQKRTADYKDTRHYGNLGDDLGVIADYDGFLDELAHVFAQVHQALRPGAYCAVVVMDLRKKNRFFPYHSDLASRMVELGFIYDDLIIWDRGQEYNNLRPLGYPSVFRVNKVHEFILIFQKPKAAQ